MATLHGHIDEKLRAAHDAVLRRAWSEVALPARLRAFSDGHRPSRRSGARPLLLRAPASVWRGRPQDPYAAWKRMRRVRACLAPD